MTGDLLFLDESFFIVESVFWVFQRNLGKVAPLERKTNSNSMKSCSNFVAIKKE